jgi:hypothetical protein
MHQGGGRSSAMLAMNRDQTQQFDMAPIRHHKAYPPGHPFHIAAYHSFAKLYGSEITNLLVEGLPAPAQWPLITHPIMPTPPQLAENISRPQ